MKANTQKVPTGKIIYAGGGTGGHIYPILALHEELTQLEIFREYEFFYLLAADSREYTYAKRAGLSCLQYPALGGMPRSLLAIWWSLKLLWSTMYCLLHLSKIKPSLIFSTGGYASAPVVLAASLLKIPYVLHNLDAILGLANRAFAPQAAVITIGLGNSQKSSLNFNCKGPVVITGNPVRKDFISRPKDAGSFGKLGLQADRKLIIVTGGSQGAASINKFIISCVQALTNRGWQVVHQLGEAQFSIHSSEFPKDEHYHPKTFIHNLADYYTLATCALCRAGAMTLSELICAELPAILVPLPNSAQNHQLENAKLLSSRGCCYIIEQSELYEDKLIATLENILEHGDKMRDHLKKMQSSKDSAAKSIANIIRSVLA